MQETQSERPPPPHVRWRWDSADHTPFLLAFSVRHTEPHSSQAPSHTASSWLTTLIIPFFWTMNLTNTLLSLIDLFIVISYCYIMTLCLLILFGMYLNFGTSKRSLIWCLFWSAKWRPVFLTVPSLGSVFSSKEFININKRSMPDSPFLPLMPFLGKSFLESSTSTPLAVPSPKGLLITKAKSWDASQSSASKYVGINDL